MVCLKEGQRQSGPEEETYRDDLERLGTGTFGITEWMRWTERTLKKLSKEEQQSFSSAVKACARHEDCFEYNVSRIKAVGNPVAYFPATHSSKTAGSIIFEKLYDLPRSLLLCKGATFRLTWNLYTAAGLTNGAQGTVHSIIYAPGSAPPDMPLAVIAVFDKYLGKPYLPDVPKSVVIVPVQRAIEVKGKTHVRTALPMKLAYALTVHSLQGATLDKAVLNAGPREFSPGLLLVGASRTKKFENLAFDPELSYKRVQSCWNNVLFEERRREEQKMLESHDRTIVKNHEVLVQFREKFDR